MSKRRKPPRRVMRLAKCVSCGARNEVEAERICKPSSDQSGEYSCPGEFDAEGNSVRETSGSIAAIDAWYAEQMAEMDDA